MTVRRVVRIMDLEADAAVIASYDQAHAVGETPAAVVEAQHRHGFAEMEIFRVGNRLVMIAELADDFDPAALAQDEGDHPELADWQSRMAALQRPPFEGGPSWPEAHCVFRQSDHLLDKDEL